MKNRHRRQKDGSIAIYMKEPGTEVKRDGVIVVPARTIKTVISAEDFEKVDAIRGTWYARDVQEGVSYTRYAMTCSCEGGRKVYIYLHRYIMDAPDNRDVDHKDRDGLNNRRDNLTVMTRSDNNRNRRRFHRTKRRERDDLREQEREFYQGRKARRRDSKAASGEDMPF